MKAKIIVIIAATVMLLSCAAVAAFAFSGNPEEEGEKQDVPAAEVTSAEEPIDAPCEVICEAESKMEYPNLRGTRYRNLYLTKYPNLVKTMEVEKTVPEGTQLPSGNGGSGGGGNWQVGVGSAADPGFSGSVGAYSLSDKTVAAHLSVQGTDVQNRAIWQADGNTNYYTNGSVTWAAGTAHLRSGELSQNTVIYGHNWNNCFAPFKKTGPEFESLMAYSYEDFVAENQYIYLTTNSGVHTFKVFAVCFTKDLSFYINCNDIDVSSVAAKAMGMSLFDFGVSVSDSDKLITLSTCTRYYSGLGANQRFIIMGKLVNSD